MELRSPCFFGRYGSRFRVVVEVGGGAPLVATKLTAPTLPSQLVERPQLTAILDAATGDPSIRMVLVSAPAGSGKSTLLADWQSGRADCAWMQADKADRDPARFWGHVVAALSTVSPGLQTAAGSAVSASACEPDVLLERLTNELATSSAIALVVDDYHLVSNPAVDDAVERLIELAPPTFRLILSTRADPSLRLARLRVRSQLVEIRADTLRFAAEEARLLFRDPKITGPHIDALCERTEGWAAGLVLAGLSLSGSSDFDAFVDAFHGDNRLVVDYLTDEFLAGIGEDERDRMLRTAILDRMSGPLVDVVCETTDGAVWLRETAADNQLLISLDSTGTWYRYHHLLEDVLRLEAEQRHLDLASAHARAARWHHNEGIPHDAVEHYLAAGEHEEAADLIYDEATNLMNGGQLRTIADQISRLGPLADQHAGVLIVKGWISLLTARFGDAKRCLESARLRQPNEDEQGLIVALDIMTHMATGNVAAALEESRAAGEPLQSTQAMTLGAAHIWAGDFAQAQVFLDQAERMASDEGHLFVEVVTPIFMAIANIETGATNTARANASRAIALTQSRRIDHLAQTALAYSVLARTTDDPTTAIENAQRGVELARRSLGQMMFAYALACGGDVLCHYEESHGPGLLAEARSVVDRCQDPGIAGRYLARVETRHHLGGQTPEVAQLVEQLTDREMAVLRYLPSSLSQREIANELYVSVNTVKTHSKAIYRKLAVGDRKAAVQAGRDEGLL